jgi:hypothetical protein
MASCRGLGRKSASRISIEGKQRNEVVFHGAYELRSVRAEVDIEQDRCPKSPSDLASVA